MDGLRSLISVNITKTVQKVLDSSNGDDDIEIILLGAIAKKMVPYGRSQEEEDEQKSINSYEWWCGFQRSSLANAGAGLRLHRRHHEAF